jgi:ribosomal protein S18 acetylase RimI-like enzyme
MIEIRRVTAKTPLRARRALDRILVAARPMLVRRGEHLASVAERLADAEGDPDRVLLYARDGEVVAGVVEARLHSPEAGDLAVAQIAVAVERRRRGVARALVDAAMVRARKRGEVRRLVAAVHPRNAAAIAFWERLGLAETGDRSRASVVFARLVETDAPTSTSK